MNYHQGQRDCIRYYKSQGFASLSRDIKPEDAIKLFFTNETEANVQVSMPLPKWRQEWIKGFKDQQRGEV